MKTLKPEEVFEYLKPEYNYIAQEGDGSWVAYSHKPDSSSLANHWINGVSGHGIPLNIDYTGDWKDSLHCRDELNINTKPTRKGYSNIYEQVEWLENQITGLIHQLTKKGIL